MCLTRYKTILQTFCMLIREGHSTFIALTQMTDDWLREIDDKNIVGAVLLDFSATFDIIDHSLTLEKHVLWLYTSCYNVDKELPCLTEHKGCYLMEASNIIQVESGIPQGTCLRPLLFSIFTNDMPLALKTHLLYSACDK